MTTLAANTPRAFELGDFDNIPVIASDTIFAGSAVGIVDATGHARPLNIADRFAGFAEEKVVSGSTAAEFKVLTRIKGQVELTVTGVVITDRGQPVYATDDNAFTMQPAAGTSSNAFIGFVKRFVSAGIAVVAFDVDNFVDPYGYGPRELLTGTYTLDIQDNGKTFFIDTTADIPTLPATVTPVEAKIVNIGPFGTVEVSVSPNSSDKIQGPDLPGTNDKDHDNDLATARRGDYVVISNAGDTNGAIVMDQKGLWTTE